MRILTMGPIPPIYTGQSIAFDSVVKALSSDPKNKCDILNLSNTNSVLKGISLCFKIIPKVLFNKYDVIYFTCSRRFVGSIRDFVLLFLCKLKKIRVINHLHGDNFKSFIDCQFVGYKYIMKWLYNSVDTSIVLLNQMQYNFDYFPNMNIEVVANSYSSDFDRLPDYKEMKKDNDIINIIYMSNIMKAKGILNLLEAFEIFMSDNEERTIYLTIAGSFIEDYLSTQSDIEEDFYNSYNNLKSKYPNNINYIGAASGIQKIEVLFQSDIFILPTYHISEAFPISIIEAMRAGNYIISTNHNYIPDLVTTMNGCLVKPNSTNEIAEAVMKIISNKKQLQTIQNYNIQYAMNEYNEKLYLQKVLDIIYKTN